MDCQLGETPTTTLQVWSTNRPAFKGVHCRPRSTTDWCICMRITILVDTLPGPKCEVVWRCGYSSARLTTSTPTIEMSYITLQLMSTSAKGMERNASVLSFTLGPAIFCKLTYTSETRFLTHPQDSTSSHHIWGLYASAICRFGWSFLHVRHSSFNGNLSQPRQHQCSCLRSHTCWNSTYTHSHARTPSVG